MCGPNVWTCRSLSPRASVAIDTITTIPGFGVQLQTIFFHPHGHLVTDSLHVHSLQCMLVGEFLHTRHTSLFRIVIQFIFESDRAHLGVMCEELATG